MNFDRVEKIAEAVLYEGYMLYPYRPSSVKNQQRWNFGVLCPPSWSQHENGSDPWMMQTECLVKAALDARLTVKVRFLQLVERTIGRLRNPGQELPPHQTPEFDVIEHLEISGRVYRPWQEAVEREQLSVAMSLDSLASQPAATLLFPAGQEIEYLRDDHGVAIAVIVRRWQTLNGSVEFGVSPLSTAPNGEQVARVTVRVRNFTPFSPEPNGGREAALPFSLLSAHTILGVERGEFISLLDPEAEFESFAADCQNIGTWPVLAGDGAEVILSSPIILYDHPQIAEESAGNLFDSTEIDEILSLRILTLSDEEKREMRQSDQRTREILERTEMMPQEQFMKLHGVLRGLTPFHEEAP